MGIPGCPEFACWTMSTDNILIVFMQSSSRSFILLLCGFFNAIVKICQIIFVPDIAQATIAT
jgi:hypothetical protein